MAVAWPVGIPAPLREGFGYVQADLLLRSGFSHGADQTRIRRDGSDTFSASLILDTGQWAFFRAWWAYETKDGAEWVLMPVIIAGSLEQSEVRILGELRWSLIGPDHVRVNFSAETRVGTTPE